MPYRARGAAEWQRGYRARGRFRANPARRPRQRSRKHLISMATQEMRAHLATGLTDDAVDAGSVRKPVSLPRRGGIRHVKCYKTIRSSRSAAAAQR